MSNEYARAIVNPVAGGHSTYREWPQFSKHLIDNGLLVDHVYTEGTGHAIKLAMEVHPDERIQSVNEFKEMLLGDWNPRQNPKAALPAPNIGDFIKASEEQMLAWMAVLLLVISIFTTLMK